MCGIVAIHAPHGRISNRALDRATNRLRHRGPDGCARWVAPHGRVGLGHTRLSLVDLDGGAQPLASEDGAVRIVANGELYDHERIGRELERSGHGLRTRSDAEIVVHLYEDAGVRSIERLRGEFAFVLWDELRQTLVAARDRFGVKPLFYAHHDGALYVASEAKALFAAGVPAAWDERAALRHLQICLGPEETLFAGVRQVPPGHVLVATRDEQRIVRYWDLDYPTAAERNGTGSESGAAERLAEVLDEAVQLRLRADVRVGCLLSGGIDSSAVLGLAARHSPKPMDVFTVAFDGAPDEELAIAEDTAARAGAVFHRIHVTPQELADNVADAVRHGEHLLNNANSIARYVQSRTLRALGFKAVLSGDGADEVFAGYGFFRADLLLTDPEAFGEATAAGLDVLCRKDPALYSVLDAVARHGGLAGVERVLGFTPAWMAALEANRSLLLPLLRTSNGNGATDDAYAAFLALYAVDERLRGREPLHQSLYLWAKSVLPNHCLFADLLHMSHGVEVRMPYLDHVLVEHVAALPPRLLIRGMTEKWVLREAARDLVTRRVYERPKRSFFAPPAASVPGHPLYDLTQDVLRGRSLDRVPFVDRRAVVRLLDSLPALPAERRAPLDPILMLLLSACFLGELLATSSRA
jgi:asparagine synthase (glutamine-hydrolysing)